MAARFGLAEVLRRFGARYLASHALSAAQAKVWRAIAACRSAALGGHVQQCEHCGALRYLYHSCRNRHCPQCQTRAKEAWIAARHRELLPVPYFHLVFTLPHALNGLIGCHARLLYELLFAAVSATLSEFAAQPRWLGGTPAFTLVLHTWKQDLGRHVHVHALVAGGALSPAGQWMRAKRGFLFPVKALSEVFRGKFLAALSAQREAGRLRHDARLTPAAWAELGRQLRAHHWVVYAKQPLGGPAQVLDYLGRYTHRVAISNERIVALSPTEVSFRVRADKGKRRLIALPGPQFIGRFLLHMLPPGFKRIRHYGLLGPAHKAERLSAARAALEAPAPAPAVMESVQAFLRRVARLQWLTCAHCGSTCIRVLQAIPPQPCRAHPERAPP